MQKNNVIPKVLTTKLEHPSVLEPLRHMAEMGMIEIIYLENDEYGVVSTNHLKKLLEESGVTNSLNIILVSTMYASNELGTVMPVKEIGRMIDLYNRDLAKDITNITFHIDAMQAGNYLDLDVLKLRVHLMTLNSAKLYGPKGVGVLFKKRGVNIAPIFYGGGQEKGLRSGTENVIGISGLTAALEVANKMKTNELRKMLDLNKYLRDKIKRELPEAKIYSKENDINKILKDDGEINYFNVASLPNVLNIGLSGMQSDELVIRLSEKGFEVSHKSACASEDEETGSYVLKAIGASDEESNSNIRISMGRETLEADLDEFVEALKALCNKYSKKN
jgi:cysteine desulfurase